MIQETRPEVTAFLSIVVTARDAVATQRFVDELLVQVRRTNLSMELILVDAAPALNLPAEARRIESGAASEWAARNAGIRRARGEFILCTSARDIFPEGLVEFLASRQLRPGCLYRVKRKYTGTPAASDIAAPGKGIEFGAGWYPPLAGPSGAFRRIDKDAELLLRVGSQGGILRFEVEAPSGPLTLYAIDGGVKVAEWSIAGRDTILINIPPSDGPRRLGLHFSGPPESSPHFFRCDWKDPAAAPKRPAAKVLFADRHALMRLVGTGERGRNTFGLAVRLLRSRGADIFDNGAEFIPGDGWHYRESTAGAPFRWVDKRAELDFCFYDGSTHLALLVEPGPAFEHRPFDLEFRLPDGKVLALAKIDGMTYVEVPVPLAAGVRTTLILTAEGAAAPAAVAGDTRVLAYCVLACGRGPARQPCPLTPWAAHTVQSLPVERAPKPAASFGDFQLMAREHWLDLRGFTEFEQPCAGMDTLLSVQAACLGIDEQILPDPLRIAGPPEIAPDYFTAQDLADLTAHMRTLHAPMIWNRADWGRGDPAPVPSGDPYLSIVVAARNDNHGGNMLVRMQAFLDSWIGQAKRYNLASEMIVVEWNPPPDRGPLRDALRWPADTGPCTVRFIQVPAGVHQSLPNASAIPLHQMIAKNAGIRRARGQFVLATNLDIVFSPELMQFLASRQLDPRAMYRMDRYDVANRLPDGADLDELLEFCKRHIIRVAAREGTYDTDGSNIRPVERDDIVGGGAGIQLGRGWYEIEQYPGSPRMRYFEPEARIHFEQPAGESHQMVLDMETGPSARDGWVELEVLDGAGAAVATVKIDGRQQVALTLPAGSQTGSFALRTRHGGVALTIDPRLLDLRVFGIAWGAPSTGSDWKLDVLSRLPARDWVGTDWQSPYAAQTRHPRYLHSNACGDFTLLSREAWFAIRGYPEFPFWPTHIDAFLCYSAYHAGFREVVLEDPLRVFHIDHAAIWTPGSEAERSARAATIGVSLVTYPELVKYIHYMRRFNAPLLLTTESWGLRDEALPESGA